MQIKWAENAREKQKSQGLFRMVRSKPLVGYRTAQSDRNVTYTVTAGSKMDGIESCEKLLDGDIHTKWCEACYFNSSIWVEFKSDKARVAV